MPVKHQPGELSSNQRSALCRHKRIHSTIILSPRVYGVEYWSEENRKKRRAAYPNRLKLKKAQRAAFYAKCEAFGWHCQICGKELTKETVTVDHIVPVSRGGTYDLINLQPLCQSCNARKRDRTMKEMIGSEFLFD